MQGWAPGFVQLGLVGVGLGWMFGGCRGVKLVSWEVSQALTSLLQSSDLQGLGTRHSGTPHWGPQGPRGNGGGTPSPTAGTVPW